MDLFPAPSAALAFGTGVALKATLVLLLAWGAAAGLRRGSAATRHLVWTAAVAGLLALPLAALALPGWRAGVPRLFPEPSVQALPAEGRATPSGPGAAPAAPDDAVGRASSPAARPGGAAGAPAAVGGWLLALWAAGALTQLARVLAGVAGVRRLAGDADPVHDPGWNSLARELSGTLGLRRPVRLLRSRHGAMPLTWGTLRPAVLLPAGADGWGPDQRRAVLLHELAHVVRRDCLVQTLALLARSLFWFHPLAWLAVGRLRTEREMACDDRVLRAGVAPTAYASHLLEVARSCRAPRLAGAAAVAMARPSQLEGRLLAVLDAERERREPSLRVRQAAGVIALVLFLPLASLRAGDAAPAQQPGGGAAARGAPLPDPACPDGGCGVGEQGGAPPADVASLLVEIAFADADPDVQREAAETLGELPGDHGTAELVRIARTHPAAGVRGEAAEGLGTKATDRAVRALLDLLERERDAAVLDEAVEALAEARANPEALRALPRIARQHPDPRVRAMAVEELGRL